MTLSHGMVRLVRRSWDRIDETVTAAIEDLGVDLGNQTLLDRIGPDDGEYDCGWWGCAYPTNDRRFAVKITADPAEGVVLSTIIADPDLRLHPGIAYTVGLWRLPEKARWGRSPWRDVFVILREDITPIPEPHERTEEEAKHALLMTAISNEAFEYNHYKNELIKKGRGYGRLRKLKHAAGELEVYLEAAIDNSALLNLLGDFMWEFTSTQGAALSDIHGGNVGIRRHNIDNLIPKHPIHGGHRPSKQWVAFDLGHSEIEEGREIPLVRNPSVIQEMG